MTESTGDPVLAGALLGAAFGVVAGAAVCAITLPDCNKKLDMSAQAKDA